MICLYCGHALRVSNSRPQRSRNQVWRRRHCPACDTVFTSQEALDLSKAVSVADQPFNRDKLFISLYDACRHRPTAAQDAGALADTIIKRLLPAIINKRIDPLTIVAVSGDVLKRFDTAAAVRYAAFHKKK